MTDLKLSPEEMIALILKLLEKPKVIAFNAAFWDICKDVNTALFLSQLFYWSKTMGFKAFYKSIRQWEEETHLSRYYIDQARDFLKKENILFEEKKGVPCRVHYKLNLEGLLRSLMKVTPQFEKNSQTGLQNISKLDCESFANKFENSSQTITENNTEINKEKDISNDISKKPFELTEELIEWGMGLPARWDADEMHQHYDYFLDYMASNAKTYKDPVAAFRNCVRGNWAKLRQKSIGGAFTQATGPITKGDVVRERNRRLLEELEKEEGENDIANSA